MRRAFSIAVLGAVAVSAVASGADFPPTNQLPTNNALPDPTILFGGGKVTDLKVWEAKRRPELRELFQHYMYGKYPARPERVTAKVLFEEAHAFGGKGTLREIEITFGPPEWPKIYLLLAVPTGKTKVGCYVGPNFQGNHCLVADERVRITPDWYYPNMPGVKNNRATAEGRGKALDVWPFESILDRGYAVATFYAGDVQPDRPNVREGMRATIPVSPNMAPEDETATLMWWAWGIHRVVDYLVTNPEIDARRLAVVGHSRLGKTALLAGAFDDRLAVVIPHQSGCGGAGPSRSNDPKAESVKRINTAFPHWFSASFKAFNDDTARLPFDQNCLVALCAPRPVLLTNAADDLWANPRGQFDVLQAAVPAYELYDVARPVVAAKLPETGKLAAERLGYFLRAGTHSMTPADWKVFLDYGDIWLK
jgi:hypothetical protein